MPTTRVIATITFSLLALTACGSDDATSTDSVPTPITTDGADAADTSGAGASVGLKDSRFDPKDIEISAGDTVTFINNDPYDHTVTSAEDSAIEFDSGVIGQDATFEQTFDTPGTYSFFCEIHPTMRGTITVT